MNTRPLFLVLIGLCAAATMAYAADKMSARDIIDKSYDNGMMDFNSATADLKMDYIEGKSVVEVREFRVKAIKEDVKGEKLSRALLTVTKPADEAGTAFLSIENAGEADDDQFLYMSALKRTLRKGGKSGKSESFMGSQFSYGDMASKDVENAIHRRLPDETIGGIECYVVESIPKNPQDEQYSKYVTWISKKNFIPRRIKFFDLKGELLKIMAAEKVEMIDNDPTITQAVMFNKQTGNATRIYLTNIDTKAKLSPADFSKERMTKM